MKLIAEKNMKTVHIKVYEDDLGNAHVVRLRRNPLSWMLQYNSSLGRAMTAQEFAKFNRIPLVSV